jgi:hypothetical protein
MRTYLGAAIACLTLMLTGIARADHFSDFNSQCNARNKSVFLNYQVCSDDLKDHGNGGNGGNNDQGNGGNNNQGNGGNNDQGNNDGGNGKCGLPTVDNGGSCDTHDSCKPPCDPKPTCPTDPHDPAVVPLPASSALGGVGLAALALVGWVRSRRLARA